MSISSLHHSSVYLIKYIYVFNMQNLPKTITKITKKEIKKNLKPPLDEILSFLIFSISTLTIYKEKGDKK